MAAAYGPRVLVLALPRDVLEASLTAVEQRRARRPEGWSTLAARGKLRRLLGDRGGLDDLLAAADTYLQVFRDDPSLLTPAHLYLLAGDDRARQLLERLRAQLEEETPRAGTLVDTCFLLGDDAAAQAALAVGRDQGGPAGPWHRDVARLAAGRAAGDVALLDEAVASLDRRARDERLATGGMGWHDWLEIALVTRVEVSGRSSDRLVEL